MISIIFNLLKNSKLNYAIIGLILTLCMLLYKTYTINNELLNSKNELSNLKLDNALLGVKIREKDEIIYKQNEAVKKLKVDNHNIQKALNKKIKVESVSKNASCEKKLAYFEALFKEVSR
ncbi:hypothetical protein CPIN18021_0289 [Campylobacter pinnipediorum subsp. caledonicus]|uniref:Uncharacterized protein n=1 Tax=Campylobacter pinnipediorum subsp. caledonicus TaxID=1874362 RepID=A0A1S6U5W8_9BACT|nr:hypothetical protein [Campylobacter pinnipediorum]AQW85551.1 hypothetical protein CPIN18020_0310 [Campylobacter pinnipediorum subsp. caledonicus]AQW87136.1 hypothetical protein CPIN18021_0289 [Campylobacter pinnipediorum subsp. caledonicus]OPA71834.1 hypothetical protein BB381_06770 [Campylobacter pinnipediorum subsp. caledonicus]